MEFNPKLDCFRWILLILKLILQASHPGNPDWMTNIKISQAYFCSCCIAFCQAGYQYSSLPKVYALNAIKTAGRDEPPTEKSTERWVEVHKVWVNRKATCFKHHFGNWEHIKWLCDSHFSQRLMSATPMLENMPPENLFTVREGFDPGMYQQKNFISHNHFVAPQKKKRKKIFSRCSSVLQSCCVQMGRLNWSDSLSRCFLRLRLWSDINQSFKPHLLLRATADFQQAGLYFDHSLCFSLGKSIIF